MLLVSYLLVLLGLFLLIWGADQFIDSVAGLAKILRVSAIVISIILLGLEPEEMVTAVFANSHGMPALAAGNILGTNITITTLALGVGLVLAPLRFDRALWRQALLALAVSIPPIICLWSGQVNFLMGLGLLAIFGIYLWLLFSMDPTRALEAHRDDNDDTSDNEQLTTNRWILLSQNRRLIGWTLFGLVTMTIGGLLVVDNVLEIAESLGQSQGVIGATIISLGTAAETIALGVSAASKKRMDILVGGVLGSFVYNLLVTLGVTVVVHPMSLDLKLLHVVLPVMYLAFLGLLLTVRAKYVGRSVGFILIGAYVIYFVSLILSK